MAKGKGKSNKVSKADRKADAERARARTMTGEDRSEDPEDPPSRKERMKAAKRLAKFDDYDQVRRLNVQLAPASLKVVDVVGDGNCFFRAVSDQLADTEIHYRRYRDEICDFMEVNRAYFEPFLDVDEESFEEYMSDMRDNSTWGGNLELQATTMLYRVNALVHQIAAPALEICNFPGERYIQLGYFTDEHYASVRPTNAAAQPLVAATDAATNAATAGDKADDDEAASITREEKIVLEQTQCADLKKIRAMLKEYWNDANTVVERLWMEQMGEEMEEAVTGDAPDTTSTASTNTTTSTTTTTTTTTASSSASAAPPEPEAPSAEPTAAGGSKKKEKKPGKREKKRQKQEQKRKERAERLKDKESSSDEEGKSVLATIQRLQI